MRPRAILVVAACAALLAGAPAVALAQAGPAAQPLPQARTQALPTAEVSLVAGAAADTASRLCIDVLSGKAKLPAPGSEAWWRGYQLDENMPRTAMDAFGRDDAALISRATLAHRTASDGDFVVALGGAAGETCRLIIYRAVPATDLAARTAAAMAAPAHGWKALPVPPQYAAVSKLSLVLRRDTKPYLANLLTPTVPGHVAMVIVVAAVPPQVMLPPGF